MTGPQRRFEIRSECNSAMSERQADLMKAFSNFMKGVMSGRRRKLFWLQVSVASSCPKAIAVRSMHRPQLNPAVAASGRTHRGRPLRRNYFLTQEQADKFFRLWTDVLEDLSMRLALGALRGNKKRWKYQPKLHIFIYMHLIMRICRNPFAVPESTQRFPLLSR